MFRQKMKKAKDFIKKLGAGGGTYMQTAWIAALKLIKKHKIDTVYFLTDGEPGDNFDEKWLKQAVRKQLGSSSLKINCITIGDYGKDLMKKIARNHHGSFVLIP